MKTATLESETPDARPDGEAAAPKRPQVTGRALTLGFVLSLGVAALNAYFEQVFDVHFVGGTQLPNGALFVLVVLVVLSGLLRAVLPRFRFDATELLTVYSMCVVGALVSTPGTENSFLTGGAALGYFASRENRWAETFYNHVPSWWAPGWDGSRFQSEVIENFYLGGAAGVPWHAWTVMLLGWGVFIALLYGLLFFSSLLLRKQWIENEALTFPLAQLPLQMVERGEQSDESLWRQPVLWIGFGIAGAFHLARGLNFHFPDFPVVPAFQGNPFVLQFTEAPWNSIGYVPLEIYFGAIGIAYLLTREVSFSFWVFYLIFGVLRVAATQMGYSVESLPRDSYTGSPSFLGFLAAGGWLAFALLLLWPMRQFLGHTFRAAFSQKASPAETGEPFGARFMIFGFLGCALGLFGWSLFAGLNPLPTLAILGGYWLASIVLARLVVEGGMIFPQIAFSPTDVLSKATLGSGAIGEAGLSKLAFLNPVLFADMRAHILPAFLQTFKVAHELNLEARQTRRLALGVLGAALGAFVLSVGVLLVSIYSHGGLSGYRWFTDGAPQTAFKSAANSISQHDTASAANLGWMTAGAGMVLLLVSMRARFLWFPLHPLGFLAASSPATKKLWVSFFLGWLVKTLVLKYGGSSSAAKLRPFAYGLILGNATAMVLWLLFGLYQGAQIPFWPA